MSIKSLCINLIVEKPKYQVKMSIHYCRKKYLIEHVAHFVDIGFN